MPPLKPTSPPICVSSVVRSGRVIRIGLFPLTTTLRRVFSLDLCHQGPVFFVWVPAVVVSLLLLLNDDGASVVGHQWGVDRIVGESE